MTEQSGRNPATLPSPALALRDAVRPAAVAYAILAGEKEHASALAEQADQLVALTRSFLEGAGLAHLLGPAPSAETPARSVADKQKLLAAYANAGMQWAKVMSAAAALGETLIANSEWASAQRLTAALHHIGEAEIAKDLMSCLSREYVTEQRRLLSRINDNMPEPEIIQAIEIVKSALRCLREYAPDSIRIMPYYLGHVNTSVAKYGSRDRAGRLNSNWSMRLSRLYWSSSELKPSDIEYNLEQLEATFTTYKKAKSRHG